MNKLPLTALSRRRFVQGLAAGGVLTALPGLGFARSPQGSSRLGSPQVLSGREIDLVVAETPVNFTGVTRMATTINGSIPAPTLRLREGDEVTIRVTNRLSVDTSIHWHGIILPYQMDGVPGLSFKGIAPGETFTYQFKLQQSGTYWYHSHSGFQEMSGMYGALIIEPRNGERIKADREHIVQLSDWTDDDPMRAFSKLKIQSDIYNFNQPTFFDFTHDVSKMGFQAALEKRQMWNEMRMSPTDLNDLSAATLTFLMNGTTPAGNWNGIFKRGERIRLRFINAASNSYYDVRIPGLKLSVVQADGQDVKPISVDEFRFGPGETYDVVVEPEADAYTIFAQSMDRSGYARGTLSVQPGATAAVPAVDPVEWLTMGDMMGDMSHGSMDRGAMGDGGMDHSGMDHSQHGAMPMDHSKHDKQHDVRNPLAIPSKTVNHASTEYGPSVDMRVDMPRTNLDDPGIGLRNNGRRVLTFTDLKSVDGVLDDHRPPTREIELHLTGNMERYSWSFDGLEFGKSTPVSLRHGERVRIILQNDTMMTHPMHLHGMWSDLETDQGELLVRRHTITVQPAQRISFLTTPHDLGRWAWHCHLLFHMDAGMFREVVVS
ncbi:copper resistance system multicopper oxidase [Parahaliea sp. F7430]|uniref:Copper resistance system multicopper oxidase n=1 Tax=Sediminihaliea albiluteola TaxID=2758564 RepID=A0A7W2YIL5_9GAMM|nr:copper resistance system multicopper oxidase [Sediminihaliea albiluteola]MBA6412235.1 copper resistance system multicopper oxidase [Sediminihaliea albiluteola]